MQKLLLNVIALLAFNTLMGAQTAVVTRNVNLRSDPSINNPPNAQLVPGSQLQLVGSSPTSGYYQVKTDSRKVGFVWAKEYRDSISRERTPAIALASPSSSRNSRPIAIQ